MIIKFGATNSINKQSNGASVGTIMSDTNIQALLGFGSNVEVYVSGVKVSNDFIPSNEDTLDIQTVSHQKA